MANEMLTGLLNQSNNQGWWQGQQSAPTPQQAPTSGYGDFTPTPPPTQPPPADQGGAQPAGAGGTPPPQQAPPVNPNQGYINMLQQQLVAAQNNLQMVMQNVTKDMVTGQPKPSMNDNAKINNAKHEITRLQGELAQAQLKAQQAGY